MDLNEFVDRFKQAVSDLQGRLGDDVREDVLSYLDTGEEGVAVEFLIGALIHRRVPVTRTEVAMLLELMRWFDLSLSDAEAGDFYTALTDPDGTAAQLTIVDKPS